MPLRTLQLYADRPCNLKKKEKEKDLKTFKKFQGAQHLCKLHETHLILGQLLYFKGLDLGLDYLLW